MATATLSAPTAEGKQAFRRRLRAWYRRNRRDLPWRRTHDPYAIWISEIMLQQTTVAAVIPYYERFLKALPNVHALAAADEQQVLKLWEGLGYYRRARQLHAAAKVIQADHDGVFPTTAEEILSLPGIGRYTAGAIASFAYDLAEPIVEANTARLYARLLALKLPLADTAAQRELWSFAETLIPRRSPGEFNQALIELGGTVCKPRDPDCRNCPVKSSCETHRRGWQEKIPRPAKKPHIEEVHETAVVVKAEECYLLVQRGPDERWAGMWDFPRVSAATTTIVSAELQDKHGVTVNGISDFVTIRHAVTRFRITLTCLRATARRKQVLSPARWANREEIAEFPLTTPARRIARKLG